MRSKKRPAPRADTRVRTVGDTVKSLFPAGTIAGGPRLWSDCPQLPSDVFAGAALLLDRSGAYSALRIGRARRAAESGRATLWLTPSQRDEAMNVGRRWLKEPQLPGEVKRWWSEIWARRTDPIFVGPQNVEAPKWWLPALYLLIAADEAARGVGYVMDDPKPWFAEVSEWAASQYSVQKSYDANFGPVNTPVRGFHTIADRASADIACVLPKSRTAMVGSTLRSLTHHLALLPPQGIVTTPWFWPREATDGAAHEPFNLLLIPFPFTVDARSFRPKVVERGEKNIGWFEVKQDWLSGGEQDAKHQFAGYVESLVKIAERDVGHVHGIVFPELALNWDFYQTLRTHLLSSCLKLEMLVAGLNTYPVRDLSQSAKNASHKLTLKSGNFAVTTLFNRAVDDEARSYVEFGRAKHHRWKLDGSQITKYALGASLDPCLSWWENIDLTWREVEIGVVRNNATMTSLICEDLARLDPSQIAVRTIGPTLVIALLMDGPQLSWRWSSRNATVLAEDPGSAVLTFTSMGLINRMNQTASKPENRCVGLWRDDRGEQRELHLKKDSDAILITLSSNTRKEWTLDGRGDQGAAVGWTLSGERYVTAEDARPKWIRPT